MMLKLYVKHKLEGRKVSRQIGILILTLAFAVGVVQAQTNELDPTEDPLIGQTSMSEYSWSRWSPDYATVNSTGSMPNNGVVYVGEIEGCQGYTTVAPHYKTFWYRDSIREHQKLRIFFVGYNTDTILLIHHDDGSWWCNDDVSNNINDPMVEIDLPRTGDYTIWIMTPSLGASIGGRLYFTLQNYDPDNYLPQSSTMPDYVGQGSGTVGARFIYAVCKFEGNDVIVSTDAVIDNMAGNEMIRLAVTYNNREWYSDVHRITRPGSFSYDYSDSGEGPLEVQFAASNVDSLNLTLTVQSASSRSNSPVWTDLITPSYTLRCDR